ncbi:MAG: sulfotransferase family 2 domain-containing protein [Flavobacteriales bacterium]|nr:sulfotransferase family 2 domain-containing protein [Flavobacteriales bacterium]
MIKNYFLHIPKAAGSTLSEVFRRNYGDKFCLVHGKAPGEELIRLKKSNNWRNYELIWLHGDWGSCEVNSNVLTMLREPISRMESFYFYVKTKPKHYLHDFALNNDAITFFEKAETLELNNGQCRILSGNGGYHGMLSSNSELSQDTDILSIARENLLNGTLAFGLQDRFVESLMLFENELDWQNGIRFKSQNKRSKQYSKSSLSQKEIDCLMELNKLDIQLYNEAVEVFNQRFESIRSVLRELKYSIFRR